MRNISGTCIKREIQIDHQQNFHLHSFQEKLRHTTLDHDIEKCFDNLWLADCVNSLWENGIKNDILLLIYFMNTKAQVVVKTPFGQCGPFICSNVVRQGTVLRPVLNNCSLDKFSKESYPYGKIMIMARPR